jgi:hypothetical protein
MQESDVTALDLANLKPRTEKDYGKRGYIDPDGYDTFMPVLRAVFAEAAALGHPIDAVLEHGIGRHSTPFFASICDLHVAVESDLEWLAWGRKHFEDTEIFISIQKMAEVYADEKFHLIFVDGPRMERLHWLFNLTRGRTPMIVYHDLEQLRYYGYDRFVIPPEYSYQVFASRHNPRRGKWTGILTHKDFPYYQIGKNLDVLWHDRVR